MSFSRGWVQGDLVTPPTFDKSTEAFLYFSPDCEVAARSSSLVLLSFSSTLCVPCGRLKPELQQLALEMPEVIFLEAMAVAAESVDRMYIFLGDV